MDVHDPPVAQFLAEYHRRARNELGAVASRRGWWLLADPFRFGVPLAPDDCEVIGDDPADIERRPIAARDVALVELPQPRPMLAALVGVAIEVEKNRVRCGTPD